MILDTLFFLNSQMQQVLISTSLLGLAKNKQTNANSLFKSNRLGVTMDNDGSRRPKVHGDLLGDDRQTRCWNLTLGSMCDPNENTGPLQRCPFSGDPCSINNPHWPSVHEVATAVRMSSYDGDTYNKSSRSGFRNYMEGFSILSDNEAGVQSCSKNQRKLCRCETGDDKCHEGSQSSRILARLLHNSVLSRTHTYI